jgi:heme exporter protein C
VALLLGVLTLLTGMIFAKVQWGAYWNWDPRQTSFLFAMLFVAAYFALRAAFDDPAKRAANSAAYSVASLLPLLFLIFVFPKLESVRSLHPNVVQDGGFDPTYRGVFLTMLAALLALCVTIYRLAVRAGMLEHLQENLYAELADRNPSASPRVVRPVPVPESSRQESP